MMDILHSTTAWLGLSFLVFLVVLWKMGKDAFIGMLDSRIDGIKQELETAETLRTEAQELLAQYQRKHRDAVQESEAIVAEAKKNAAEIKKNAEAELKELIARREQQLTDRITRMERAAETQIREYAIELAIEATREIITQQLTKTEATKLVNESIKNLPKTLAA